MLLGKFFAAPLLIVLTASFSYSLTIDTVPVGNAGNSPDTRYAFGGPGFGSVDYEFRIGKYEITNAQYVEFLNNVAASDPYGLFDTEMQNDAWGGIVRSGSEGNFSYAVKSVAIGQDPGGGDFAYDDKPVAFISWFDAIRFANWLHNGQGIGDTETGAYTLLGGTMIPSNANSITRNPGARWWLPSENEWYKAAYYDPDAGIYYDYPTGTNSLPNNNLPSGDTGDSANFSRHSRATIPSYPWTDVGAYGLSSSPYGTFDQGGNAEEWNDTTPPACLPEGNCRGLRGGPSNITHLHAQGRGGSMGEASRGTYSHGFRVATNVPEPGTLLLSVVTSVGLLLQRPKR